jgi:hypothetical protein
MRGIGNAKPPSAGKDRARRLVTVLILLDSRDGFSKAARRPYNGVHAPNLTQLAGAK